MLFHPTLPSPHAFLHHNGSSNTYSLRAILDIEGAFEVAMEVR